MAVGQRAAAAPVVERRRVGMKLEDFSSGGVLPEGDYLVKESSFVFFAYTNKAGQVVANTTAHRLLLVPFDVKTGKPAGDEAEQHWSVGDQTAFVPSEDGNFIDAIGQRAALSKQSNFYIAYETLVNAGLPEPIWEEQGAGVLVGMVGHIAHVPAPDRSSLKRQSAVGTGVAQQPQPEKPKFDPTIPVFKTIIVAPWDKKGGAKASATRPASKPAGKQTPPPPPLQEEAAGDYSRVAEFIKDAVAGNGGKMARTKVRLECHRRFNTEKIDASERDAELNAVFGDESVFADVLASVDCLLNGSEVEYAG